MVEKLLVLDYYHDQIVTQLKYWAQLDTQGLNLVTRYGSLFAYNFFFPQLQQITLGKYRYYPQFEGIFDHSNLVRAYSGALTHYLVPLELENLYHTTATTVVKVKVTKVDLTTGVQRILLYQHIQQFFQSPPIWLGDPVELISTHQVLNPL